MIYRPREMSSFEFVRVSALRAGQLMAGAAPRVDVGYGHMATAQREVAAGMVRADPRLPHHPPAAVGGAKEFDRVNRSTDSGRGVNGVGNVPLFGTRAYDPGSR